MAPFPDKIPENRNKNESKKVEVRFLHINVYFIIAVVLISIAFQIVPLYKNISDTCFSPEQQLPALDKQNQLESAITQRPIYWLHSGGNYNVNLNLRHVAAVLHRFGFERGTNTSDWNLFWSHTYPFVLRSKELENLKSNQKVNHIPGVGCLGSKVDLATANISFIPRSFRIPQQIEEMRQYSRENPKILFVQKHVQHRNIEIVNISSIDFTANKDKFIQEFIGNPLLIDGFKFDIGIYTIITSIDPLRVYIYTGDVMIRYCRKKYWPFYANDVEQYIVLGDYRSSLEIPGLEPFFEKYGFGMRGALDGYLKSKGRNPATIWDQVENAIRQTILIREPEIISAVRNTFKRQYSIKFVLFFYNSRLD